MNITLFNNLLGPTLQSSEITALQGVFARYEANFYRYAERHWTLEGSDWASANYYDRAKIFYEQWVSTGDPIWRDRADALALNYRVNYLEANNWGTSAHWNQIGGVALHYSLTGDPRDLLAIGNVADVMASPYYLNSLADPNATDNRIQARVLDTFLYAWKVGAPSDGVPNIQPNGVNWGPPGGNDWAHLLRSSLEKILASQGQDGGYHFSGTGNKPFMVGMVNDALINYYNLFEHDQRIIEAVKKSLDYMWNHNWDNNARAFIYDELSDRSPAPDLNNMIVSGFGWVYMMTGDETYRIRGDQVFAGGVDGAWLDGSKQFNESYTTSYKYLAYAHGAMPPPVERDDGAANDQHSSGNLRDASLDEYLQGSSAHDLIFGEGGNDYLVGGEGEDTLDGGPGDDLLFGGAETDFLEGWTGRDYLNGEEGNDELRGGEGADTLDGGQGSDVLLGWSDDDFLEGWTGNDELFGEDGNDELRGGDGEDLLDGGGGNDVIRGWDGRDTLIGGSGDDVLIGEGGTDFFLFFGDSGRDRVVAFQTGAFSDDVIVLSAGSHSLNSVLNFAVQDGAHTVLNLGGANTIVLENVNRSSLHEHDFLFV